MTRESPRHLRKKMSGCRVHCLIQFREALFCIEDKPVLCSIDGDGAPFGIVARENFVC